MCINIVPFEELFEWQNKSSLKAGLGKQAGKYCFFICSDTVVKRFDEYLINKEALIFGTGGKASIHYCNQPFAYSTDCAVACKKNDNIILKYIYYYFRQKNLRILQDGFKGSGLQHISKSIIGKIAVPVPPLEEQRRIVAKIEELFSLLESGTESLQKAKGQLAAYRQAVLKEAFADVATYGSLGEIIEQPKYGTSKKCSYSQTEKSFPVFRIPNIYYKNGNISHTDLKFADFSNNELSRIDLKENDILIIRSNGSVSLVGRAAIIRPIDTKATFAGYLMRIRLKNTSKVKAKYLYYYLESCKARLYIENVAKSTSGVHNINSDEVKHLSIPLCDETEIQNTVSYIESRLSVCDNVEKTIETALEKSEALRQSILRQAFEGGL